MQSLLKVADYEAALSSEREAKSEIEKRVTALEESKARLENEAASSEVKRRGLAEAAAGAEARLESMASERRTLLEMNEDLSVAAQGPHSSVLSCDFTLRVLMVLWHSLRFKCRNCGYV